MSNQRPVSVDDVNRFITLDDARISPDGTRVAFVQKQLTDDGEKWTTSIRVVDSAGGAATALASGGRNQSPRWSPDGGSLAFVSDRAGVGQIFVIHADGGEPRQLTTLARGATSPAWSSDGTQIAFLSTEGNGTDDETRKQPFIRHIKTLNFRWDVEGYHDGRFPQLWVVDVDSGEARQLTFGDHNVMAPTWSPDGHELAFVSNRTGPEHLMTSSQLYAVPADGGEPRLISDQLENIAGVAWAPDGSRIAIVGTPKGKRAGANNDIVTVTPDGEEHQTLTDGWDRSPLTGSFGDTWSSTNPTPLTWLPDGTGVLFTASDRGRVGIYLAASAGAVKPLGGGDRTYQNLSISADGKRTAFMAGSFTNPCDVYAYDSVTHDETRLTNVNADLLAELTIQEPEHFTYRSFDDAYDLDAWRIRPVGVDVDTPAPLVQIIHGGPHSIWGHTFFFDMQLWASQGWNVLFMNPRATQGYGEEFSFGALGDWGGVDWKEQEQALDLAIEQGGVDPNRLAVTGLSYGGFMTNWIIGQTNRYRVAASENSISNLVSFYGTSDIGWNWLEREMERPIWENLDWYMRQSPIWYVEQMRTPTLFLQAEDDFRCPIEQGEQLYKALLARNVPAEMVRFPGESHAQLSSGKPETRRVRRQVTLDWFKRYLDG